MFHIQVGCALRAVNLARYRIYVSHLSTSESEPDQHFLMQLKHLILFRYSVLEIYRSTIANETAVSRIGDNGLAEMVRPRALFAVS